MKQNQAPEPFPLALDPPAGEAVVIDDTLIETAIAGSRESPRRRIILPLHVSDSESLNRMLNAIQPGSYVRPHRHVTPPKAESIVVLRGSVGFLVFSDAGEVTQATILSAAGPVLGIDCRSGAFHTFVCLDKDTVVFEVKPGPYVRTDDKDFAGWAPMEKGEGVPEYLAELQRFF